MQKYIATAIKKDVNNPTPEGETPAVGVDVYVYLKSTGAQAIIYSDNGVTQKTQPLVTDSNGRVEFYAANGRYNIEYNLPSGIQTDEDIILYDPEGSTDLSVISAAITKAEFDALAEQRKRENAGSGFLEWGKHHINGGLIEVINEGLFNYLPLASTLLLGNDNANKGGFSRTNSPVPVVNGAQHLLANVATSGNGWKNYIKFPPAPDGTKTYDSATSVVTQHANVATAFDSETATNKVITSRKDLVFLESWREAIEDKDQVYWLGNVQQGANNPYGAPNLTRSDGYTRFGEWDTTTTGKYSTWSALTDAQKLAFIQDSENNIYYDSEVGKFIQVRYRMRTTEGKYDYQSRNDAYNDAGLVQTSDAGMLDYDEFKVIPIALVQRLNQGAYHPTYNPEGCATWAVNGGGNKWYNTGSPNNSAIDCFIYRTNGYIGTASGRTDQYDYYDAIYAGLVEDLRLPSTKQDYSRLMQDRFNKAIAGTVRGKERLPFTSIEAHTYTGATEIGRAVFVNDTGIYDIGDWFALYSAEDGVILPRVVVTGKGLGNIQYGSEYPVYTRTNGRTYYIISEKLLTAEYDGLPWVDIVGDPERISVIFPDGVIGQWISDDWSTGSEWNLNRKAEKINLSLLTNDDGASWLSNGTGLNTVTNKATSANGAANRVWLHFYEASSNHTQASNRIAVEYEDFKTFASSSYLVNNGNRLASSVVDVIGKVNNESAHQGARRSCVQNKLGASRKVFSVLHNDINSTPNSGAGSKGVKSTAYLVEKDGLIYVQYLSQEIEHDGVDWGDSGFVQIKDGDDTYVNDNGVTLKASCHTDIIPIAIADYTETNK